MDLIIFKIILALLLYDLIKYIVRLWLKGKFRIWETVKEMFNFERLQGFFFLFGIPTIYAYCYVSKHVALYFLLFSLFIYFSIVRVSLD